jgi:hypothetical protein
VGPRPQVFRFPVKLEELWERSITIDVDGVAIHQPEPGDYLLVLCAHGSKHCWSSLIWIADIAAFLRMFGNDLDWVRLLGRAATVGGEKQLLLGLRLAHELMNADLPQSVAERLRAYRSLDRLVADVHRALFAPAPARTFQRSFGLVRGGLFYMRTRERIRDRLPHAVYLLGQSLVDVVELAKAQSSRPRHRRVASAARVPVLPDSIGTRDVEMGELADRTRTPPPRHPRHSLERCDFAYCLLEGP